MLTWVFGRAVGFLSARRISGVALVFGIGAGLSFGASCSTGSSGLQGDPLQPTTETPPPPSQPPYVPDRTPLSSDYSIFEHGKDCFERFQVEVPTFDCDGAEASRLKIEVNGREVVDSSPAQCDRPSLVGADMACVPGARVTRFDRVNRYGHTIATVALCRRGQVSALESGRFDNIAIVQSDLDNGETCWYQIRKSSTFVGRGILPAYSVGRKRGDAEDVRAQALYESPIKLTTDHTECTRCHDGHLWLQTPWIAPENQVPSRAGNVHKVPRSTALPTHLGKAYRDWNKPENRPARVNVQRELFDRDQPLSPADLLAVAQGTLAPSDACTQCHTLGKSALATSTQGTCNVFARFWMANRGAAFAATPQGRRLTPVGRSFPAAAWMPPGAAASWTTDAAYRAYYRRAFGAIERCCDDPTRPGCFLP